jgi:hypothetical protein
MASIYLTNFPFLMKECSRMMSSHLFACPSFKRLNCLSDIHFFARLRATDHTAGCDEGCALLSEVRILNPTCKASFGAK